MRPVAAVRRTKKRTGKAKRKAGAWTDAELVRAAFDLYELLGLFFVGLKGVSGGDQNADIYADEVAALYRPDADHDGPPEALRIGKWWLECSAEAQERARLADLLTTYAAYLACGVPGFDLGWILPRVANERADGHPTVKERLVRAAIAKPKNQTDIGRALKVFNLLADGASCDPGPQANRAPRGALKTLLEAKIAMAQATIKAKASSDVPPADSSPLDVTRRR